MLQYEGCQNRGVIKRKESGEMDSPVKVRSESGIQKEMADETIC